MNINFNCILTLLVVACFYCNGLDWQHEGATTWAKSCMFEGFDVYNEASPEEDCKLICQNFTGDDAEQKGCSHYTWTSDNGGTCWIKRKIYPSEGVVTKDQAIEVSSSCGINNDYGLID